MRQTTLKRKTQLKSYTPLKAHKGLNKVSNKQRERTMKWNAITDEVAEEHSFICQWCGRAGLRRTTDPWKKLDGHHKTNRSQGGKDTKEDCYISHQLPCHRFLTDNNVDVRKYPSEEIWKEGMKN